MKDKKILGVGFLLFSTIKGVPSLFTVEELKGKPQYFKSAGMISFPLETYKEIDENPLGTVQRLLAEEVGILPAEVKILEMVESRFNLIPGRFDIETVYGYGLFLGNPEQEFCPTDDDIRFSGWKSISDLLASFIRIEVAPILEDFLKNHSHKLFL